MPPINAKKLSCRRLSSSMSQLMPAGRFSPMCNLVSAVAACWALLQELGYYRSLGICFTRLMTDNCVGYRFEVFGVLCVDRCCVTCRPNLTHPNQRQGLALHPDPPPKNGPMPAATKFRATSTSPAALAASLQLASPMPFSATDHLSVVFTSLDNVLVLHK